MVSLKLLSPWLWHATITSIAIVLIFSVGSKLSCSVCPNLSTIKSAIVRLTRTGSAPEYVDKKKLCFIGFTILWLWRYTRLLVHLIASWTFQPVMPRADPTYRSHDCTVVLATTDGKNEIFGRCVESVLANRPCKLVIVTPIQQVLRLAVRFQGVSNILVLGSAVANKRFQQICGLRAVNTEITVFCDDDVIWPTTFLHNALAIFEDVHVGGGGTCQRLLREHAPNIWEFLGAAYLERRNFEFSATTHIDGGTSALSGRTQLIRTCIIKDQDFMHSYLSEKWLSWLPLKGADDDNFITRWLVNHRWRIRIQYCPEVELRTTLGNDRKFLGMCVRWFRTTWRSNITSMLIDRVVWSEQPWCSYALHLSTLNPPAAVMDGTLAWLLFHTTKGYFPNHVYLCMTTFVTWLVFTKTVKLIPHFKRYPSDLKFLPCYILFGYFHGLIKLYALLTVGSTKWLGRKVPGHADFITVGNAFGVDGMSLVKMGLQNVGRQLEVAELDLPESIKRDASTVRSIFEVDM